MNGTVLSFAHGFALVELMIWCLALGMVVWGTWLTLNHLRPPNTSVEKKPISILKPLKGLDFELEENLESFFRLEYPKFELLFSVAHESDEACMIVRRLIAKYPRVRARISIACVVRCYAVYT